MIERVAAPLLAGATVVAASVPQPVVWSILGHPFDAASMVAALFAATTTRVIIGLRNRGTGLLLDLAIWMLVITFTAVFVSGLNAGLVSGLLLGTGCGVVGEGLLKIAERYTYRAMEAVGVEAPTPPGTLAPEDEDHPAAISVAMGELKRRPPVALPTHPPVPAGEPDAQDRR